jgi:uncharacterized protein
MTTVGAVAELFRYPVKSMLGETCERVEIDGLGVIGDRAQALVDVETGRIATAKQPRWWRELLHCRAATVSGEIRVTLPDGRELGSLDADDPLSEILGRPVRMSEQRADGAEIERPEPEEVLEHGLDADLDAPLLQIAMGTPGGRFVDYAPVHLITTATLDEVGVETLRYRPNIVVRTPEGTPPFVENDWLGRRLRIGGVEMEGTLPTPRCSVPTLEHGDLGRSKEALRTPAERNKVWVSLLEANLPCVGMYTQVVTPGVVRTGDAMEMLD